MIKKYESPVIQDGSQDSILDELQEKPFESPAIRGAIPVTEHVLPEILVDAKQARAFVQHLAMEILRSIGQSQGKYMETEVVRKLCMHLSS